MQAITASSVPVAWRQLLAEPAKLVVAVAAAVARVLLLSGLRRGIGQQVTYLGRQPPVLVGQVRARAFQAIYCDTLYGYSDCGVSR